MYVNPNLAPKTNPVEEYAMEKNIPATIMEILKPLGNDSNTDWRVFDVLDAVSELGEYANSSSVESVIGSAVEDGTISDEEHTRITLDIDGDYVSTELEMDRYKTNPTEIDTDGGGMDDFNELVTYPHYGMNPNDPQDDAEFMERIPNVIARHWEIDYGGEKLYSSDKYAEISMRDPYIQWLAERAEIKPAPYPIEGGVLELYVNGEEIHLGSEPNTRTADQPSYYFTHGRKGNCAESSLTNLVILKLMGYKVNWVSGKTSPTADIGHAWNEALIDGEITVVNYDSVYPRDEFYENKGWIIDTHDYDPDWYKE
ncbi:MAG: transglutaminase domain-containing protein [Candidatus Bathyarchaeota archaeon]|nr:MAG: transglutaminase domain-containing protein [Candidatus Bathyarchaeota archaeon]